MQSDSFAGETLYITTKTQGEPASLGRGGEFASRLLVAKHQTTAPSSADGGETEAAQRSVSKSCPVADIMYY